MAIPMAEAERIIQKVWPDWHVIDVLGVGGFATVYRAVRKDFAGESYEAVKIMRFPQNDEEWKQRLQLGESEREVRSFYRDLQKNMANEIRLMKEVAHYTNIVSIEDYKDYHVPGENIWYVLIRMELLEPVNPRNMSEKEIIRLGIDMCTALKICRERNIVHRDVKLANVFRNKTGEYKLGDFGVSRELSATTMNFTSSGTPLYMAPEVYKRTLIETDIDAAARVDIYSLGIVLYTLCQKSRFPFEPSVEEMTDLLPGIRQNAFSMRMAATELPAPDASPALQNVILKACRAHPEERYASAAEMLEALKQIHDGKRGQGTIAAAGLAGSHPALHVKQLEISERKRQLPDRKKKRIRLLVITAAMLLIVLGTGMAGKILMRPEIMSGDVNGDGRVNFADVIRLQKYASGWNAKIITVNCDLNGDRIIDFRDVARLRDTVVDMHVDAAR